MTADTSSYLLNGFFPTPQQEMFLRTMCEDVPPFEVAACGTNRSGTTMAGAAWLSAMALDLPITPLGSGQLNVRPARWSGDPLRCVVVGKDNHHLNDVIASFLLRTRDDGKSFIPNGMIAESTTWENKRRGLPKKLHLTNGTTILFHSSQLPFPKGEDANFHACWIDCGLSSDAYYSECLMGVANQEGYLAWSVSGEAGNSQCLERLLERSQRSKMSRVIRFTRDRSIVGYHTSAAAHNLTGDGGAK